MLKSVGSLITAIGSYASLAGLWFTVRAPGTHPWEIILISSSAVLAIIHIGFVIYADWQMAPVILENDKDIQDYMRKWTRMDGRTSVLSRDMSWARNDVKQILTELASRSNLTVFMQSKTSLAKRLKKDGAEVLFYGQRKFKPMTWFAFTNEGRSDARVAIGFKNSAGDLRVEEYEYGDPAFYLANDIVSLLRILNKRL